MLDGAPDAEGWSKPAKIACRRSPLRSSKSWKREDAEIRPGLGPLQLDPEALGLGKKEEEPRRVTNKRLALSKRTRSPVHPMG